MTTGIKALTFDVFGTVVDWRTSVASELQGFFQPRGVTRDWQQFIADWRGLYQPAMQAVRSGAREFVILDTLHRENLITLLAQYEIDALNSGEIDHLTTAWHRLNPWPDSVAGMLRLRENYILAALSNGNVALMVNLARHGNLPWDAILGAEFARAYKPDPKTYAMTAVALGLRHDQCLMVAAHNEDLAAAAALGFKTAYVNRPLEHGPGQTRDLGPNGDWDFAVESLTELADQLETTAHRPS